MLELYRAGTDYRGHHGGPRAARRGVRARALARRRAARRPRRRPLDLAAPFERLTVADAFRRHAGDRPRRLRERRRGLAAAARAAGHDPGPAGEPFDDVFFRVMLDAVEPRLGREAAGLPRRLARLRWRRSRESGATTRAVAERFELYAGGLELANGFTELTDAAEQRRRFVDEQALRRRLGRPVYPLDERFLDGGGADARRRRRRGRLRPAPDAARRRRHDRGRAPLSGARVPAARNVTSRGRPPPTDQCAICSGSAARTATTGRCGSSTWKAAPSPGLDSTRTVPPWASTIRFTM